MNDPEVPARPPDAPLPRVQPVDPDALRRFGVEDGERVAAMRVADDGDSVWTIVPGSMTKER